MWSFAGESQRLGLAQEAVSRPETVHEILREGSILIDAQGLSPQVYGFGLSGIEAGDEPLLRREI